MYALILIKFLIRIRMLYWAPLPPSPGATSSLVAHISGPAALMDGPQGGDTTPHT